MKNKLFKTLTPLVLVVLLIATLASVFVLTAGADTAGTAETTGTTTSFVKVTATPTDWSGEYLIVYEAGGVAFDGSLAKLDATSNTVAVTIINNKIEYTNDLAKSTFTIEAVDGGYSIKSASGYYIGRTATGNGLTSNTSITYTNDISFSDDTVTIKSSAGTYLRYNNAKDQQRFRYFGSGQQAITLYKLVETGGEPGGDPIEPGSCTHPSTTEVAEVPATCTTAGTTAGVICANESCKEIISGCEPIPFLGHDVESHVAQAATCTEVGWDAYETCKRDGCDYTTYNEIPATGIHTDTNSDGKCDVCGAKIPTYIKVDLENIKSTDKIIIVSTKDGNSYALSNDKGTSAAPTAVAVTITNDTITTDATNILWNIKKENDNLTIYPDGTTEKWLYCTNTNNGVRVGTNDNKIFTIDNESGYLKNTATGRFLGVYNKADWRCYTTISDNIKGQTFFFYKYVDPNCKHPNTTTVDEVPATCMTPGTESGVVCDDCGKTISGCGVIPPTGHKDTTTVDAVDATCTENGYTVGVYCNDCNTYISGHEEIVATGHSFGTDNACSKCGAVRTVYTKVADVTTLKDGDVIVIYYPEGERLLSGTASGTKLEGVGATVSGNYIYADNADELALTVRIYENGYYCFVTADGKYLTGTGSNNLTLGENLSDSAKWSFNTEGTTATLRIVNKSNGLALEYYEGLFTIYNKQDTAAYNFEIYSVPTLTTVGASLNTGVTIRVTYNIPEAWLTANSGAKVVFTCEGETKEFDAVSGSNTYYVNLASHLISKAITVQIVDREGNALTASEAVSLSIYRAKLEAADLETLKMTENQKEKALALIDAALTHSDYASGALTEDIELTDEEFVASGVVKNFDGTITVKANLSAKIKLIIGITSDTTPTVTVDGQVVECDFTNNVLTIGGLYHTKFNDEIVISVGEIEVLKFTFNSYLKAIYSSGASDKNLAAATYLYGVAAEAYISAE